MRIKFTAAFDKAGDETGTCAEVAEYSPDLAHVEEITDDLVELYRSAFDELASPPCQRKRLELSHAIEQDRSTGAVVWRVFVRGFMCCQPAALSMISSLNGLTHRFMEYREAGVAHPPTDADHYRRKDDDENDDGSERLLN